jgi:Prophage protein (DUF1660)
MLEKLRCKVFGHKLILEIRMYEVRLNCIRCGQHDPYAPRPKHPHEFDNRESPCSPIK